MVPEGMEVGEGEGWEATVVVVQEVSVVVTVGAKEVDEKEKVQED